MRNRIDQLFEKKKRNILSVYFTAGYPQPDSLPVILSELEKAGVDLVEIGIPFSDPTADGPVIQQSNHEALVNGMSLKLLFRQLAQIRNKISIPLILMGYFNPVYQFGIEPFCLTCRKTGIDGVILPDLPMREYELRCKPYFEKYGLHPIFLITPETSDSRIREIDAKTTGFIYMVSTSSTTGKDQKAKDLHQDYFERVQQLGVRSPRLVGFGIAGKKTFQRACQFANGAIIGTAFIKALKKDVPMEKTIPGFIHSITG